MPKPACCQCSRSSNTANIYGYVFCDRCTAKLGLHSDKTILKNSDKYDGDHASYEEEVVHRIEAMEKSYIKTKIKLMHILERLAELT
jgi:hypothetical protein